MHAQRRPAPADYLARRLASWAGQKAEKNADWRRRIVATCRAELEWATDDWRRLGGDDSDRRACDPGPHPSDAWRLPHEVAAARLVNCHLHVDVETWRLRELIARLPGQRRAARDWKQSALYRHSWHLAAKGTESDIWAYRHRRRMAWLAFLEAAMRYRALRQKVDLAEQAAAFAA